MDLCIHICLRNRGKLVYTQSRSYLSFVDVYIVGSITQISGCQDPFETESSRTKNIFSRRMNPSPIFHFLGVDSPTVYGSCCGSSLSNTKCAGFIAANLQSSSPGRT